MDDGMESRKVVEVPSDSMASPGVERAITLAGLSPVKGAIIHPVPISPSGQGRGRFENESKSTHLGGSPIFEPNRDQLCRELSHLRQAPF